MKFPIWLFIVLGVVTSVTTASGRPAADDRQLTPAEKWVVDRLNAGLEADLSAVQLTPNDQKLSGHFLENLLSGLMPGLRPPNNVINISKAKIEDPIRLIDRKIRYDVYFSRCQFDGRVSFERVDFGGEVSFAGCAFTDFTAFRQVRLANLLSLNGTIFGRAATFESVEISGNLEAPGAQFHDRAYFRAVKVGSAVELGNCVFNRGADFAGAELGILNAVGVKFLNGVNPKLGIADSANFAGVKIRHGVSFMGNARFEGPVTFASAEIGGDFRADGAGFTDATQGAVFSDAKFAGTVYLSGALFKGPVTFEQAEIKGDFKAQGARFNGPEDGPQPALNFSRAQCKGTGHFEAIRSRGELSFFYATFGDLSFRDPPGYMGFYYLNLFGAEINRTFTLNAVTIQKLLAGELHVAGPTVFNGAAFGGLANFAYSKFGVLHLHSVKWPIQPDFFRIEGMTFKLAEAGDDPETNAFLLAMAGQAKYSAVVYTDLADYFTGKGYSAKADETFIAGRRRERKRLPYGLAWIGSWGLDWVVGYGRHPWQAGIPCMAIVALGCFLFGSDKMEPLDPDELKKPPIKRRVYNRFWYSLGLFLPFVNLQTAEAWKPKRKHTFLRNYVRIHILLGWILIPILLAAISGLIK